MTEHNRIQDHIDSANGGEDAPPPAAAQAAAPPQTEPYGVDFPGAGEEPQPGEELEAVANTQVRIALECPTFSVNNVCAFARVTRMNRWPVQLLLRRFRTL